MPGRLRFGQGRARLAGGELLYVVCRTSSSFSIWLSLKTNEEQLLLPWENTAFSNNHNLPLYSFHFHIKLLVTYHMSKVFHLMPSENAEANNNQDTWQRIKWEHCNLPDFKTQSDSNKAVLARLHNSRRQSYFTNSWTYMTHNMGYVGARENSLTDTC